MTSNGWSRSKRPRHEVTSEIYDPLLLTHRGSTLELIY